MSLLSRQRRKPLATLLPLLLTAAAVLVPAPRAGAQDLPPPYDYRRDPAYDPGAMRWLIDNTPYRFDARTGRVTRPDGSWLTEEEATTPFRLSGDALGPGFESALRALGYRFEGDRLYAPGEKEDPLSRFDVEVLRAVAAGGWLEPFPADESPLAVELARRVFPARPEDRDGRRLLVYRTGPLSRVDVEISLAAFGLRASQGLDEPFVARSPPLAPKLLEGLNSLGLVVAEGRASWKGERLTNRRYLALFAPIDLTRLDPRDEARARIAAELCIRLASCRLGKEAGTERVIAKEGDAPLSLAHLDALLASAGLAEQRRLDAPVDPSRMDPRSREALQAAGLERSQDGSVLWDGKPVTVRRYIEWISPYDPGSRRLPDALLKRFGLKRAVVNGRQAWALPDGTALTNFGAAQIRRDSELSPGKLGRLEAILRASPAGTLDSATLRQLRRVAADEGGFIAKGVGAALGAGAAVPTVQDLAAQVEEASEHAVRVWAARLAAKAPPPPPPRGGALTQAQVRVSGLLQASFGRALAELSGEFGEELVTPLRSSKAGGLPPVLIERNTDSREAASYDHERHTISFNHRYAARAAVEIAWGALKPEQRTEQTRRAIEDRFSTPTRLGAAIERDAGFGLELSRALAWDYVHELGHAISFGSGARSVERLDGALFKVLEEERNADLAVVRFTHAVLRKRPWERVPERDLRRYKRMLADSALWELDAIEAHAEAFPSLYVSLPEARAISDRWAERLAALVPRYGRALSDEVARLRRLGQAMAQTELRYRREIDEFRRDKLPSMRVEGHFALGLREDGRSKAKALLHKALALEHLYRGSRNGTLAPAEAARLRRDISSPADFASQLAALLEKQDAGAGELAELLEGARRVGAAFTEFAKDQRIPAEERREAARAAAELLSARPAQDERSEARR